MVRNHWSLTQNSYQNLVQSAVCTESRSQPDQLLAFISVCIASVCEREKGRLSERVKEREGVKDQQRESKWVASQRLQMASATSGSPSLSRNLKRNFASIASVQRIDCVYVRGGGGWVLDVCCLTYFFVHYVFFHLHIKTSHTATFTVQSAVMTPSVSVQHWWISTQYFWTSAGEFDAEPECKLFHCI